MLSKFREREIFYSHSIATSIKNIINEYQEAARKRENFNRRWSPIQLIILEFDTTENWLTNSNTSRLYGLQTALLRTRKEERTLVH